MVQAQARPLPPLVRGEWVPMSWEEFLDWSPGEGQAEWVDGKGIAYVSNSMRHVRAIAFLGDLLRLYVRIMALGEVFAENALLRLQTRPSGRMPDLFVVARGNQDRVLDRWVEGAAVLAVEVISGESADRDLVEKRAEYERAGILEYVTIEARPGREGLTHLRLDADGRYQPVEPDPDGRYRSLALPGFWLDPAWFARDPLPSPTAVLRRISPEAWQRLVDEPDIED